MEDLDTLCKMYESARQFMAFHGNPQQWGQTYPKRTLTESDIASGCSYVCEDQGRIIATFYYREGPDDTYLRIYDGEWLNAEPYGVVHRITSDGAVKGAASFCLDWAFEQCGNLKIDTHRDNAPMRHLIEKYGFSPCGTIRVEDGTPRLAYDWLAEG